MIIIGLFLTCLLGFLVVRLISPKLESITALALSYLLGLGLQTLVMFYLAIAHVKLSLVSVSIFTLVSVIVLIIVLILRKDRFLPFVSGLRRNFANMAFVFLRRMGFAERAGTIIICTLFLYATVAGLFWPVTGWDSIALYDFRAKVFASTGFMDDAIRRGYFFGYPLMTSMAHTWVYLLGFNYPRFLYSFMYIAIAIIFYKFVRTYLSRILSLISTFVLVFSPAIFSNAAFDYTNLPYAVYFFVSTVFLLQWFNKKEIPYIILSGIFMGLATWIRSTDPFWGVNIAAIIFAIVFMRRKLFAILVYLAAFIPIQQSWNIFLSRMSPNVSSQALAAGTIGVLSQGIDFFRALQVFSFVNKTIGPVLGPYIILAALSFYFAKNKLGDNKFLYIILLGNFGALYLGAYVFSYVYPGWGAIGESLGRMVIIFVPLLVLTAAINCQTLQKIKVNAKKRV